MNKKYSSKNFSSDNYKPGGIHTKLSFFRNMISDTIKEKRKLRDTIDNPETQAKINKLDEKLLLLQEELSKFTSEPNNDPNVVKTIFESLSKFATKQNPTDLFHYMDELKNITITNSDINYLLEIIGEQRETFNQAYFDDVAENIDEVHSRAEAETEIGVEPDIRKIAIHKKYVKLAKHYDETQQYKKADIITKYLLQ